MDGQTDRHNIIYNTPPHWGYAGMQMALIGVLTLASIMKHFMIKENRENHYTSRMSFSLQKTGKYQLLTNVSVPEAYHHV